MKEMVDNTNSEVIEVTDIELEEATVSDTEIMSETETNETEIDTDTSTETDIDMLEVSTTLGTYPDGIYTGKALGMNAMITVSVTVENGEIADVVIESSMEDEPYLSDSLTVIDDIVNSGSTDVDVVSGATYTSGGIIDAVKNALADFN
jgi:uncharacterized protein with FMN-binding domain